MSDSAKSKVLEVRHVSLAFDEKSVLTDVSFAVEAGSTLLLWGVTGAGKSVLLKLILGLLKPDSGEILVDGKGIVSLSEKDLGPFRKRMGIVFQEGGLFDSLSVYENVAYPLREAGARDEDMIGQRVQEVLGFVEMEQAVDKMPSELSGGMRRRVAVARAIVNQPSIMLYDSPTAGLDPVTSHTIITLLAKLRDVSNVTSIVVTHRLQDGFALANYVYSPSRQKLLPLSSGDGRSQQAPTRFIILRSGTVYFEGTASELTHSNDAYLRKFIA